eukprot:4754717-Pleurochrysis_carterae.AAC.1
MHVECRGSNAFWFARARRMHARASPGSAHIHAGVRRHTPAHCHSGRTRAHMSELLLITLLAPLVELVSARPSEVRAASAASRAALRSFQVSTCTHRATNPISP